MQNERLTVKYLPIKNCFVCLPEQWLKRVSSKVNVLRVVHNTSEFYLSWQLKPSLDGTFGIGATFARSLNIKEGDSVLISTLSELPCLSSVAVSPCTSQDWEILSLQAEKLESSLLGQVSIVSRNQPIVLWVSKYSCIKVVVDSLDPDFVYGKLEAFTEVHVSTPVHQQQTIQSKETSKIEDSGILRIFKNLMPSQLTSSASDIDSSSRPKDDTSSRISNTKFSERFKVFSVLRLPKLKSLNQVPLPEKPNPMRNPYDIFISKRFLPRDFLKAAGNEFALCTVKKVQENRQFASANTSDVKFLVPNDITLPKSLSSFAVKVYMLEDILEKYKDDLDISYFAQTIHHCAYLSESLTKNLKLKNNGKLSITQIDYKEPFISSIDVFPLNRFMLKETFVNFVNESSKLDKLLLNSGMAFLTENSGCIVKLNPDESTFALLDADALKSITINMKEVITVENLFNEALNDNKSIINAMNYFLEPFDVVIQECKTALKLGLHLHDAENFQYERENILINGPVGSGKTTLCNNLKMILQKEPYFVHTHTIDCKSLKGKKVDVVQKVIMAALSECAYHEPSVLVLDDLECITYSSTDDDENTPDAINFARTTDAIINAVTEYQAVHYISVIATTCDVNKLNKKIKAPRGIHFIRTFLTVPDLNKHDRIESMKLLLGKKLKISESVDWNYFGNKTEGWVMQDLVDLTEKAAFHAWKRHVHEKLTNEVTLQEEDLHSIINNFLPIAISDINLYKSDTYNWSNIGGLANVKESLKEVLQWPLKYPELFKQAPVKNQGGILLYGMPGTGKTILAAATANECSLKLISVKGPELLSKYIGASEEAVRNVFEKARRAKPCVIFFDEFDSLAPRRGHDSTGVTDRVVNQLLTQMDGIEDREGVAVLAATSRPDLLDPALLRPGRLDKLILCPLPTEAERVEILKSLCKTQKIANDDLDLQELGPLTDGFTGADLNILLTQAKLAAFEESLANSDNAKRKEMPKITQQHLIESAKSINPSVPSKEVERYKKIYSNFSRGDGLTEEMLKNQKATLA